MISTNPAGVRQVTVEVICQTVGYASRSNRLGTWTLPVRAILPISLRSISTIITFSARFFSELYSQRRWAASSAGVAPRRAVPFIGRALSCPSSSRKNSSGEAEQTALSPRSIQAASGAGPPASRCARAMWQNSAHGSLPAG